MSDLYDRIQALCKQKGVSGGKMCVDLGLSKSLLSDMKHGRKYGMTLFTAQKIAKYLGVSMEDLCADDPKEDVAVDNMGSSIDRIYANLAELFELIKSLHGNDDDNKKQPILLDGLSDEKIELVKFAISVPDDKIKWLLQVMRTILKDG